MATNSGEHLPYVPASPPMGDPELVRAVWDEFYRISAVLSQADKPVSVIAEAAGAIQMAPPGGAWHVLFDAGVSFPWEAPKGMLDPATGTWRARQGGIYQLVFSLMLEPFGDPANPVLYGLEVQATQSGAHPDVVKSRAITCTSSQTGEVSFSMIFMAQAGEEIQLAARLAGAGVVLVPFQSFLTIMRLSGAR
jgi:hypothetical protein